jgi:hypothetical protein
VIGSLVFFDCMVVSGFASGYCFGFACYWRAFVHLASHVLLGTSVVHLGFGVFVFFLILFIC